MDVNARTLAIFAALAVVAVACGDPSEPESDRPIVVVTTSIWADVVTNVSCDELVAIRTVIPPGGDPHGFEPSLADRGEMERAALIVANGLTLEEGLLDTIDAAEESGTPVFRFGEHVSTIASPEGGDAPDPHVWFDPIRVSASLPALVDALVDEVGLDRARIETCAAGYVADLAAVDRDIGRMVVDLAPEDRRLVTNHDSLGYFAERYGFEIIGTVIPSSSTMAETNPAQLEALAREIERSGVAAIFVESQHSRDDADSLSSRLGDVDVVTLFTGTLDAEAGDASTYVGFLSTNARLITAALE